MYDILLLQGGNGMKITIEKVRDWLLENRVDGEGDLNLIGLDFSEFDGDVHIGKMKVKRDLIVNGQDVQGDLFQGNLKVQGNLFQSRQEVQGNYYSRGIEVNGDIEFEKPTKMLKKITLDELKEMGYELMEDY